MHRSALRIACLRIAVITTIGLVLRPAAAPGQETVPIGSEFQINSSTTGNQTQPDVAVQSDGSFLVVWEDSASNDALARRFSRLGDPQGGEFLAISSVLSDAAVRPSVATFDDDSFIATAALGSSDVLLGRRFDAQGQPLGGEFPVDSDSAGLPSTAVLTDQTFVVSWFDSDAGEHVKARRFASTGTPLGAPFQVDQNTSGFINFLFAPEPAPLPGSSFVVVYGTNFPVGDDTSGYSVQARVLDSSGLPVTDALQVNQTTSGDQNYPAVAANDNEFVVTFENASDGMLARRFDSFGTPLGDEFVVSSYTSSVGEPSAAYLDDGSFVVVWGDAASADGDPSSIQARRFSSDGMSIGAQFRVNTFTTAYQGRPSVQAAPNKSFVVTWESFGSAGSDQAGMSIQGQIFGVDSDDDSVADVVDNCPDDPNPAQTDSDGDGLGEECDLCFGDNSTGDGDGDGLCADVDCNDADPTNTTGACLVFDDGFETGDTSAWSATVAP